MLQHKYLVYYKTSGLTTAHLDFTEKPWQNPPLLMDPSDPASAASASACASAAAFSLDFHSAHNFLEATGQRDGSTLQQRDGSLGTPVGTPWCFVVPQPITLLSERTPLHPAGRRPHLVLVFLLEISEVHQTGLISQRKSHCCRRTACCGVMWRTRRKVEPHRMPVLHKTRTTGGNCETFMRTAHEFEAR